MILDLYYEKIHISILHFFVFTIQKSVKIKMQ